MSDLTPASIAATFTKIAKEIEEKAAEVEQLDQVATIRRAEYKRKYAKVFLTTEASNDVRRYTAEFQTADDLMAVELAEQVLRAAREALKVLRDRLEIGRSMSAVMRMEWTNARD
jgi:hypothetical protein